MAAGVTAHRGHRRRVRTLTRTPRVGVLAIASGGPLVGRAWARLVGPHTLFVGPASPDQPTLARHPRGCPAPQPWLLKDSMAGPEEPTTSSTVATMYDRYDLHGQTERGAHKTCGVCAREGRTEAGREYVSSDGQHVILRVLCHRHARHGQPT